MVKITAIALAVVATITPFVAAKNCQSGLQYCGSVLLRKGNYYSQIVDALESVGEAADSDHVQHTLFQCTGGSNGDIDVIKYCGSACQDGGNNHSDSC
ncbi:hypothetical protein BO71DRAFT_400589 [Aspergillus ellipticus CBS 707.79]|uniref:Uncharacterized protein n=1 Tax=Aspergillus ellipticus CBS 707.79 TaxID=1448320 RepID=A0A319D4W4_9EURO|nr:hypothetical protein BO71DRAFT_400589 [Aspergillus ellipticus CBS 707.79]